MMKNDNCDITPVDTETTHKLKLVLWVVFALNLGMFIIEFFFGLQARSSALMADSLDMFADAFVYGISLFVLNKGHFQQAKASMLKGGLMVALGLFVLAENIYKIIYPVLPSAEIISTLGLLALIANVICVVLLLKYRDKSLNVKSAWICSRNDAFGNIAVIIAGLLVAKFSSQWPDIIIGFGLAFVVIKSSFQIIASSKDELAHHTNDK